MFSFPILYPGEAIERQKETDPVFSEEVSDDEETGEIHEVISLGVSSMGYDVKFPVKLFKKHAFIAGVPGAGKTNTMLYLVTTLWRDTRQHVPFLVLEPAKQEYRALAMIDGMEDLCVFSPGADTKFPLHINPFQFPVGLTLAEHIANLNTVFAGAFELIPPSPFLIDGCIEKVYIDKGWNINERNDGTKEFPTMQELYDSLKVAVEESGYEGETKSNIRSVMEVRIGSLLRREIGNVYNVYQSSMEPEEWLERPIIIELESLGEGPANFMSLLISTLIREVLKIKKTSDYSRSKTERYKREIEHIIFYEEAHNLIGSTTDDPVGGSVDPKISATKFLVKMLAEVRALGEGIVIADQLPTAMASEVLKNTGLKIGHRITAQDDRNLLGSTMSASADQLEEQGTFGTGQALVFYENLLRPFKMRISEWERGASQTKYDSPTNIQLYEHLKDNEIYKQLLLRSALIMQSKMKVEFDQLRNKAEMLKLKCDQNCSEIQELEDNLFVLKRKYFRMDRNETSEIKKHIANTKREYEKKKREFSGSISQELKKTCWSYANQYYAYMTLSKNYSTHSNDMYMCTINNYISLFTILKSFPDIPELTEILMSETINVMTDIKRYVDYMFEGATAILQENTCYKNALFECGNYLVNCMNIETIHILKPAIRVANLEHDSESEIIKFTKKFTSTYFKFLNIAKKYAAIAEVLSNEISEKIRDSFELNSSEWGEYNARAVQYKNEKQKIYMTLAQFVVKVCKQISVISGMNRKWLLININEMLVSFRSIVDYRDRSAPTILSKWTNYSEIWKDSNDILVMEMSAKFTYLHQYRRDMMITLKSLNDADKISALSKIACQYNGWFKKYSKSGSESSSLKLILVNHYIKYLEAMIRLGTITHSILINTSSGNWRTCLKMMKNLMQEDKIDETKRESWKKLSIAMAAIFNATIK